MKMQITKNCIRGKAINQDERIRAFSFIIGAGSLNLGFEESGFAVVGGVSSFAE